MLLFQKSHPVPQTANRQPSTAYIDMVQGSEKRAAARAPLGTKVHWTVDKQQWHANESQDVSSTGMMIRTDQPIPPGTMIKLKFQLPNLNFQDPIIAEAEVMRLIKRHEKQIGLGVRFVTLKSLNYKVLEEFVCRILGLPLGDDMSAFGSHDAQQGYSFTMERLARETEERKMKAREQKIDKAKAVSRKATVRLWSSRATLAGLICLCAYLLYLLGGFIADLIATVR